MANYRLVALVLAPLVGAALAQNSGSGSGPRGKVVFVCEHGAAKSVIAAEEFRKMAKESGLDFTILSRGTTPDPEIAPGVRKGLASDGVDLGAAKPVKVAAADLAGAITVVSFGPDLRGLLSSKDPAPKDWSDTPSPSQDYLAARDHIRKHLKELIRELAEPGNSRRAPQSGKQ